MNLESTLAPYFKPEVRKQGSELVDKNVISIASVSDSCVEAFIRVSAAAKVILSAESISAASFTAVCNCSAFAKGQACKHVWAVLSKLEAIEADFLVHKESMNLSAVAAAARPKLQPRTPLPISAERQKMLDERKESARIKANEYRKAQYRLQKERKSANGKSESKAGKRLAPSGQDVPEDISDAFRFFDANGFPLTRPIDVDALKNAKRLLSRIFHPDKGGSHEEILALNENFDKLIEFSQNE